ncbi:P-loop containing nucleoside triphosphate hydrolase protein [Elsinoe ampelina]|uniref:RNA helicase n=1 Tax=Elsinoe ampelina TaxID=302913 RepID=A0A6A6FXI6_9PEZI|nr:P-loop containing nucleoside triphosphate hydrolase protein [Elsinoe ampelina]
MSKRSREEAELAGEAHQKEKREKKHKRRKTEDQLITPTDTNGTSKPTEPVLSEDDEAARKAAKAARKAEKKALKEQKRARKETSASDPPAAATKIESQPSTNGKKVDEYAEASALSDLPESDVDEFLSKSQITILDETKSNPKLRPIISFDHLELGNSDLKSLFSRFKTPTPIQSAAWPYLLSGRDAIGVAETGSGKTMAFGLPCVQHVSKKSSGKKDASIRGCIVSPTRELALQIHEEMEKLTAPFGLKATVVYGGVNKDAQRETLRGSSIIVATPGRLNDYIEEGSINLSKVTYLVLDEADRMLDTGFEKEIRKIASQTSTKNRQTLMFTATWPPGVRELAATFMNDPVRIMIGDNATGELRANTRVGQKVEVMDPMDKQSRLVEILRKHSGSKGAQADRALIFCLYKKEASRIEDFVRSRGYKVAGIHGDLSQQKRTESLDAFKTGKVRFLVATDVAARGLDIPAVKLVINYTFPLTADDYVHRIGRTGRAGQTGESITFFTEHEKPLAGALVNVLKAAKQPVPEELLKFGTTVKKKAHDVYGAFYRDPGEMKKATKITFD